MVRLLALVLMGVFVVGCGRTEDLDDPPSPDAVISGTGTVQYIELEGGFYGIVADDSTRYLPRALEDAFREDGMRVRFRVEVREDVMTAQMWGQPVRILEMAALEDDR